jgi:hypothetical protein
MLDVNPAALPFDDFKRYSFFDREQDVMICTGAGPNIAFVIFGNH